MKGDKGPAGQNGRNGEPGIPVSFHLGVIYYQTREMDSHHTDMRVKNTICSGVLSTNFEVFGNVVKHCLQCLIYLLNQNQNLGESGEIKS